MKHPEEGKMKHPEDENMNIVSKLTFSYYDKLLSTGTNKYITDEDIFDIKEEDKSSEIIRSQDKYEKLKIFSKLLKTHGLLLLSGALYLIPELILSFTSPYLLKQVVEFINLSQKQEVNIFIGILYSFLLFIVPIFESIFFHQYVNIIGKTRNKVSINHKKRSEQVYKVKCLEKH
jgi:ATP-binding cassette, subfamily C (CFTR/MRP), member 1